MAINTRVQLKAWFHLGNTFIVDRISSVFDSFIHKTDDCYTTNLDSDDQDVDYSVVVTHNLNAEHILVQLEDSEGNLPTGINTKINYVESEGTFYTDSIRVEFSDTIPTGEYYKLIILKIK